jgi:hypothetical protein
LQTCRGGDGELAEGDDAGGELPYTRTGSWTEKTWALETERLASRRSPAGLAGNSTCSRCETRTTQLHGLRQRLGVGAVGVVQVDNKVEEKGRLGLGRRRTTITAGDDHDRARMQGNRASVLGGAGAGDEAEAEDEDADAETEFEDELDKRVHVGGAGSFSGIVEWLEDE